MGRGKCFCFAWFVFFHQPFLFYINQSTSASTPTYIISSYSPPYFKEGGKAIRVGGVVLLFSTLYYF